MSDMDGRIDYTLLRVQALLNDLVTHNMLKDDPEAASDAEILRSEVEELRDEL